MEYQETRKVGKTKITMNARLSDPCHNGHNDFAFTAEIYHQAKNEAWVWHSGGCCHEAIKKYFPEVAKYLPLHSNDEQGRPLYYIDNAVYLFEHGNGVKTAANYLNIDEDTAKKIWEKIKVFSKKDKDFCEKVESVYSEFGLFEKWQKLADECKNWLVAKTKI